MLVGGEKNSSTQSTDRRLCEIQVSSCQNSFSANGHSCPSAWHYD